MEAPKRSSLRILVCGGRDFTDYDFLHKSLDTLHEGDATIIHGGARGADSLAGRYAQFRELNCLVYRADWDRHKKAAGPIRNQKMLTEGRPDIVVAFPGGRGTADMVSRARKAGVEVWEP